MVQINFALREVNCKIVYYGPGLSGKTTNLEMVHQKVPADHRGELTSIATEGDRTLFFDFMPLDLGKVAGMNTKLQLYTVPGQVYYNATRKIVLQGADGIVFVVDSQQDKMEENLESLNNLEENLKEHGVQLSKTPCVLQYNKRDLPNITPVEELEAKLNRYGWPFFEAVAITGDGVLPTLKRLAGMVLESLNKEYGMRRPAAAPAAPPKREPAPAAPSAAAPQPPPAVAAEPPIAEVAPVKPPVSPPQPAPAPPRPKPLEPRRAEPAARPISARRPGAPAARAPEVKRKPVPPEREDETFRPVPVVKPEMPRREIPKKAKKADGILFAIFTLIAGLAAGITIEHFFKVLEKFIGAR
jgi:hypothetical protein